MTATLLVASLVTTAVGAGMQYSAQRRAADAQEAAAEYNAQVMRNQAQHENDVAAENMRRQSVAKQKRLAALRAKKAGSGLTFSGSVLDQLEATNFAMEREIQDSVFANEVRQGAYRQKTQQTLWAGKMRAANTRSNANASLLMNGASIGKQLYGGIQEGAFS